MSEDSGVTKAQYPSLIIETRQPCKFLWVMSFLMEQLKDGCNFQWVVGVDFHVCHCGQCELASPGLGGPSPHSIQK